MDEFDINEEIKIRPLFKLNKHIKKFFQNEGYDILLNSCLMDSQGKKRKISYRNIVGKDSFEYVDNQYNLYDSLCGETPEISFDIKDKKRREISDLIINKIAKSFEPKNKKGVKNIGRYFMIASRTIPVKISYKLKYTHQPELLFVKKPNFRRIVGLFFYNLISGLDEIEYKFNDNIIVEKAIKGTPLNMTFEEMYFDDPNYFINMGRAALHADFLKMEDDICHENNRLVTDDSKTMFFDFDKSFRFTSKPYKNIIQAYYDEYSSDNEEELKHKVFKKNMEKFIQYMRLGYQDERKKVAKRLIMNSSLITKACRVFGKQEMLDGDEKVTFDDLIRKYGAKYGKISVSGLEEYVNIKESQYFRT